MYAWLVWSTMFLMYLYHYSTTAQHNSPSIGSREYTARSDILLSGDEQQQQQQKLPRLPKLRQSSTEVKKSKIRRKSLTKHSKTSTVTKSSKLAKLVGEELRLSLAKPATWTSILANYNRTVNSMRTDTFKDLSQMVRKVEQEAATLAAVRRRTGGEKNELEHDHIRTMPEVTKMDAM